ncbi:hypothetical protein CANCADRAFT_84475 [Tortispora caseinolytica NRRL Y-17796]|uniref:DAGKc domain-containing protein n=1 Tax=Tortispora caseinolytica NRRL Y-17796 TaxID=767744 RepID=A0A1E4TKJ4_9ASCO|nr:hypothetical protein CANCADRAFT_84475 [Tortispora caseinolytica NRRL Y-17796]
MDEEALLGFEDSENLASVTIGTTAIVVEASRPRAALKSTAKSYPRLCFGSVPATARQPLTIPLRDVLVAAFAQNKKVFDVSYLKKSAVCRLQLAVASRDITDAQHLQEQIMAAAYGEAKPFKKLLVFINPASGRSLAIKAFNRCAHIFEAAHCTLDVVVTKNKGHASEVIKHYDLASIDGILCVSGDGTPHEVYNALNAKKSLETPVCMIPGGTGNALVRNLVKSIDDKEISLSIIKGTKHPVDLAAVTQQDTKYISFLSQSIGLIAEADIGSEDLRWLGPLRTAVGITKRVIFRKNYPCVLEYKLVSDDKQAIRESSKLLDISYTDSNSIEPTFSNLRTDHFPQDTCPDGWHRIKLDYMAFLYAGILPWMAIGAYIFPAAHPADGTVDISFADYRISFWKMVKLFLNIEAGKHYHLKDLTYLKAKAFRVTPLFDNASLVIDGEQYPLSPFTVEVLPKAGRVLADRKPHNDHTLA